ncbi:MAG: hypothetical protein PVI09_06500 [Anaerolineae bacterium]
MADDWTLVEYRPGRYAKVTPEGEFLGMASTAETQAWFAAQRKRVIPRSVPDFLVKRHGAPVLEAPSSPSPEIKSGSGPQPTSGEDVPAEVESSAPDEIDGGTVPPTVTEPEKDDRHERDVVHKAAAAERGVAVDPQVQAREAGTASDLGPEPGESELEEPEPAPQASEASSPEPEAQIIEAAAGRDGVDQWLWVDPRQEGSYNPASFDLALFLERAVALFESKAWTGGRKPRRLAVHPNQVTDNLTPVAEKLGLEILSDSQVSPGTYRLGLAEPGAGESP